MGGVAATSKPTGALHVVGGTECWIHIFFATVNHLPTHFGDVYLCGDPLFGIILLSASPALYLHDK